MIWAACLMYYVMIMAKGIKGGAKLRTAVATYSFWEAKEGEPLQQGGGDVERRDAGA